MSVPTLQQLIEEHDAKTAVAKIIIGGTELPKWTNCSYRFDIGQVPTATITVPGLPNLPAAVQEEASVQIWFGYKVGATVLTKLVFGGAIVDSVGNNGADIVITCVMDGPRKLSYSYNRRIAFDFDNVTANEAVTALLELAGVVNYSVNLDPWLIGTAVPYTAALGNQLQFSSYGDAINKVAEVDGSPWYAMPSGQVRVEKRDPVPSPTARRTYFTSVLTGPVENQPTGITNPLARPRINDISKNKNRRDVANFIQVDGAVVVTLGPNGEQNSNQIEESVDGLSGQFPNGAYWIPTPPLFQDFNFANELIDTNAKAFEVAERYFDLKNRLFEDLPITVPGDPDVFLGETVEVKDPIYSGTGSLYFVRGYSTTIDQTSCTTQLDLIGGPEAGTTGFASPFAEFTWTYDPLIIPGGGNNSFSLGPNALPAAKLCEDKPADSTPDENTDTPQQATDSAMVYIGLDGTSSQDFDGYIVSWVWTWYDSSNVLHTLSGPRHTIVMAPAGSINMTLTVTDNSGRTDSITKNINTSVSLTNPPDFDPSMNDTEEGGGVAAGPCTEEPDPDATPNYGDPNAVGSCNGLELGYVVAAGSVAMGSNDNRTWNDLTKASAGVTGDFISVDAAVNNQAQTSSAIFGTTLGEIVRSTDMCLTGSKVFTVPGAPRIECIHFDTVQIGSPTGELPTGDIPVYTQASPGTMTMVEAYQQCRAVGFSHDTAIVAVAIMVRESGLYSLAQNTAGNTPPSTDRGICQWNDFYHPDISDACAYNTECAITAMFRKSAGGSDFSPWRVRGGSHLTGTNLAAVQEAVGSLSDTSIATEEPTIEVSPAGLKVWAGTSDGRIYVSLDSGETWELWIDFGDGLPINQIGTPPRYGAQTSSLWVFGGDTGNIDSLVRIDPATNKNFVPLFIDGDLRAAIQAAGAGDTCRSSMNETASILVFSGGGMSERVWTSQDPLGDPTSWIPCGVGAGTYNTVAPGYGGEFVVAGSTVMKTDDNETFVGLGSGPSTINHMIWRGLPGMYAMALDGGLYTTIDFGDTTGAMRPNATFGTTWPVGAVGYQVAVSYGARTCPVATPGDCDLAPRYEAAVGRQAVSANYTTNGQEFSDSVLGASIDVIDTSLITTFYEGSAHHKSLGHESGSGTSLEITITPTIIDSFLFLAVASRPGAAPTSVTDDQSLTWTLIQTALGTDAIGPIRLSIYRTNANAASILGLTVTVAFAGAQDVILAIADEWIGLTAASGSDPVVDSDIQLNPNTSPTNYPDDYLLSYTFTNPYAFEEAIPSPISFGIALQLEPCSAGNVFNFVGWAWRNTPVPFLDDIQPNTGWYYEWIWGDDPDQAATILNTFSTDSGWGTDIFSDIFDSGSSISSINVLSGGITRGAVIYLVYSRIAAGTPAEPTLVTVSGEGSAEIVASILSPDTHGRLTMIKHQDGTLIGSEVTVNFGAVQDEVRWANWNSFDPIDNFVVETFDTDAADSSDLGVIGNAKLEWIESSTPQAVDWLGIGVKLTGIPGTPIPYWSGSSQIANRAVWLVHMADHEVSSVEDLQLIDSTSQTVGSLDVHLYVYLQTGSSPIIHTTGNPIDPAEVIIRSASEIITAANISSQLSLDVDQVAGASPKTGDVTASITYNADRRDWLAVSSFADAAVFGDMDLLVSTEFGATPPSGNFPFANYLGNNTAIINGNSELSIRWNTESIGGIYIWASRIRLVP